MTEITVPHGGSRDGCIWMSVNGTEQWIRVGEPTELNASEIEVLNHAGITYATAASGDFTNIVTNNAADGIYTLNGETVTLDDIIDVTFPDGNFDPVLDLDADGIKPRDTGGGSRETALFLQPAVAAAIVGGYTAVFEANFVSRAIEGGFTVTTLTSFAFDAPDYNVSPGCQVYWNEDDPPADRVRLTSNAGDNQDFTGQLGADGVHKIAITATDTKLVASVDGGAVVTFAAPGVDVLCNAFGFNIGGDLDARLRSFAFYEPVDDADLPILSAL